MSSITPTRTNSPSFGMALKQKDIIKSLQELSSDQIKCWLKTSKKIHDASEKAGFDVFINQKNPAMKRDEDTLFEWAIRSKDHPKIISPWMDDIRISTIGNNPLEIESKILKQLNTEKVKVKALEKIINNYS